MRQLEWRIWLCLSSSASLTHASAAWFVNFIIKHTLNLDGMCIWIQLNFIDKYLFLFRSICLSLCLLLDNLVGRSLSGTDGLHVSVCPQPWADPGSCPQSLCPRHPQSVWYRPWKSQQGRCVWGGDVMTSFAHSVFWTVFIWLGMWMLNAGFVSQEDFQAMTYGFKMANNVTDLRVTGIAHSECMTVYHSNIGHDTPTNVRHFSLKVEQFTFKLNAFHCKYDISAFTPT